MDRPKVDIDFIKRMVIDLQATRGILMFLEDEIIRLPFDPGTGEQKAQLISAARFVAKLANPTETWLIFEAWAVAAELTSPTTPEELRSRFPDHLGDVSERIDSLICQRESTTTGMTSWAFEIVRDSRGKVRELRELTSPEKLLTTNLWILKDPDKNVVVH